MNGTKRTERHREREKDREKNGGCKYHSSKINQKKKKNQNKPGVVKHCQAFQISVAHQKDLRSTQPPTHTIEYQTDRKVKQRRLFTEIGTEKSCRYFMTAAPNSPLD